MNKGLGTNANLIGMTGLCLCDKIVSIMKYPTRSKLQTTIDINVSNYLCFCSTLNYPHV